MVAFEHSTTHFERTPNQLTCHQPTLDLKTQCVMYFINAQFVFMVTAHHEQVGSFVHHVTTPTTGGFRIRPTSARMDGQAFALGQALISFISIQTPPSFSKFEGY